MADAPSGNASGDGDPGAGGGRSRGPRRTDTSDPRRSRERALRVLFQADLRAVPAGTLLEALRTDPEARALLDVDDLGDAPATSERGPDGGDTADPSARRAAPIDGFTRALVEGVAEHGDEVDALIARFARRWQIHRMPVVDRTVLRLATYELLYESTPPAVVIDQAVTLAKALSTDDSGRYVNGVLESIRKDVAGRERPSA